ncbi:uncharacterized protein LOC122363573 [Amphibalanus amphitrite]|uniref:uncharacterized protein LOC122363573 n=1 Tax=Amphibalanus amphitrite TaxID=1232801 RepID=UPI001C90E227|nr:uncharacterized protein LOC122363573 [Amphibalanus amphitrite]
MALQVGILALVEGRRLRRMGLQESGWNRLFLRQQGTGLLVYSLVIDSQRRLEPEHVRSALAALQRQYPLLRARVERVDGAEHLVAGPCPDVPLAVLPPARHWLAEHHRQLRHVHIDPAAEPLWKAALLHEPAGLAAAPTAAPHRAVLYFCICHSITDGSSNGLLLGRFLENLDRLAAGGQPDVSQTAPLPAPVEELAKKQPRPPLSLALVRAALRTMRVWYGRDQHPFLDRFVAPLDPDRPLESYWNQMLPQVMSQPESERLRALCRQHGVTMNAAVSAAVSLAAARLLAAPGAPAGAVSPPVSLPTLWMVNMRRYLPEARGVPMAGAGLLFDSVRVSRTDGDHFWQLAAQVRDQLNDHLDSRLLLKTIEPFYRGLSPPEKPPPPPTAPVPPRSKILYGINNIGSLDTVFPRTVHVRAAELHRTYRDHATTSAFGSHCFQTVAGRLCYDLNFVNGRAGPQHAERFSREVMQVLREVVGDGQGGQ